ncbi:MAG: bifunctional ADP-dependent NAD(P)H-hydrate dehydratase/NAD(P)H-hydrate epimerase, partial [Bullifex sp.]
LYSIPSLVLMESAAREFYGCIRNELKKASSVCFVAGGGNNGADALAAARMAYCDGMRNITLFLAPGRETEEHKVQKNICEKLGMPFTDEIKGDLIIDGLIGVGFSGELSEEKKTIIEKINGSGRVISIDCPSGLKEGVDSLCVSADVTVTFGYVKTALLLSSASGVITVVNPSFPLDSVNLSSDVFQITHEDLCLDKIPDSSFKNRKGHVAVFGGSREYTGAVRLAERAAFKAGAGLVTVFTSDESYPVVALENLSPIVRHFSDFRSSDGYSSLLIGPGLTDLNPDEIISVINAFRGKTAVVDAGAIKALGEMADKLSDGSDLIITPHAGEFRNLLKTLGIVPSDLISDIRKVRERLKGATVVYKSSFTVIASSEGVFILKHPNPALGVAGSGDVLAGIIAACRNPLNGVLLHSIAGRRLYDEKGFFTSEELCEETGRVRACRSIS